MTRKPDYEKAEEYFREALRVRPTHGEALVKMAALKFKTEDYLTARAFLQRYLSTNKTSPGVLFLAIQIEEALDAFEMSLGDGVSPAGGETKPRGRPFFPSTPPPT